MVKRKDKKEILYINILRILACFLVVINHTNGYVLNYGGLGETVFYSLIFSVCKIGVAVFLMITGALVLGKEYDFKKVTKCIVRVLLPAVVISLILYIEGSGGIGNANIITFLGSFLQKPYILPYWYIYALVGIYLALPFLQKMIKNFKEKDYLWFILLFLILPSILTLITTYVHININANFQIAFFPSIVAMVVCGKFISVIKMSKKYFVISIVVFMLSWVLMFLSMFIPYLIDGKLSYALDAWNSLPVILMAMATFYIVRYIYEKRMMSEKIEIIISAIASTTFGIYLVHYVLNYRIYSVRIFQNFFGACPIVAVIALDVATFVVCMIIVYILKKIPIIKKYL